jgi:hypothetical protein
MTAIPLARRLPGASCNLPERLIRTDPAPEGAAPFLFGLAPGGVCRAAAVAGGAVRSYRTVSPLPRAIRYAAHGGLFSVALSLRPAPKGTPRRTLSGTAGPWSPDFPLRPPFGIGAERPSGRLTRIGMGTAGAPVKPASGFARGPGQKKPGPVGRGTDPGAWEAGKDRCGTIQAQFGRSSASLRA